MEIVMILRKNGKFTGLRRNDGEVLQCNLPYLKDWMESQSNKIDDESSSENTDPSENQTHQVDNCSENTESGELVVESDWNEVVNVTRDGDEKVLGETVLVKLDVQESVCHLNVKDIKSSDSKVLVPSSNAAIVGQSNIPYNTSDTTFDESLTNSQSVEKHLDANSSDQFGIKDTVVQSGIVNDISGKSDGVSHETNTVANENLERTGENISPINPDVTQTQSSMEMTTNSMSTDKSSYKESDGAMF